MKYYYEVCVTVKFFEGKPHLESMSLNSTTEYYPFLVDNYDPVWSQSHFFHTLPEAYDFIKSEFSYYFDSTVPYPVLDGDQQYFF
jgi:hypothetical protein